MKKSSLKVNWRIFWYSIMVWFLSAIVGGIIVLPWFYLVLPIVVFWTTVYYFRSGEKTLTKGLWVSLFWFFVIAFLNFLQLIGPYYANFQIYFSDLRNWFLYPLILLFPVIYSLILENARRKITRKKAHPSATIASRLRLQ